MRYEAQSDTTAVPFTLPLDPAALHADFQAKHHQLFGYSTAEPRVVEGLRVEARVLSTTRAAVPGQGAGHAPRSRVCSFPGAREVETAILSRDTLAQSVHGPAIIADAWSTVVVPPGWLAVPEPAGHLRMFRRSA
jgi:N-methylhydantoinase A